jgi:hypothetical protein
MPIGRLPDRKLKLSGLTTCSGTCDDISNTTRVRGPLSAMTHEARCGPSMSTDRVRDCVSYNRVRNLSYL